MRYLVYLLLVANLGYFAWNWFQPSASPLEVRPAPVPPDVHQLVLLSERPTAVAKHLPGDAPDGDAPAQPAAPRPVAILTDDSVSVLDNDGTMVAKFRELELEDHPDTHVDVAVASAARISTALTSAGAVTGEFVSKAVRALGPFAAAPPEVACLQGILDFYNPRANWLSRCFAIEYATWFRLVLPGLARLGVPIPLGGTTVYFRREALEAVRGWDAHNVTEDADLGLRLARHGRQGPPPAQRGPGQVALPSERLRRGVPAYSCSL